MHRLRFLRNLTRDYALRPAISALVLKRHLRAGILAVAAVNPGATFGQDAHSPESRSQDAKATYTLTGNFGVFSQYIFRGLTQTNHNPAAQGGFDWTHESGFYAGTWTSNISWLKEGLSNLTPGVSQGLYGSGGSLEWDFYGGYKWSLPNDFVLDTGTLYYWYPGKLNPNAITSAAPNNVPVANTWEIYLAPGWKWLTFKGSYSLLDHTFGVDRSRGTYYIEAGANIPLGEVLSKSLDNLTLNAHWGYQKYKGTDPRNLFSGVVRTNNSIDSYKDAKLGFTYALPKEFSAGAFWSKAFGANNLAYGAVSEGGPFPANLGKSTATVFLQKGF